MWPLLLGVCLPAFLLAPCRSDARENLVPTRIIAEGPRRVAGPGPGPSAPTHRAGTRAAALRPRPADEDRPAPAELAGGFDEVTTHNLEREEALRAVRSI